jgi:hypothetical protein
MEVVLTQGGYGASKLGGRSNALCVAGTPQSPKLLVTKQQDGHTQKESENAASKMGVSLG